MIHTTEVVEVDDELVAAFERLTPQLSSSSAAPGADQLAAIVSSPATVMFIARNVDTGQIVGSLTLALFRIPTGMRAWIEDVVVDEAARGQGVGSALNHAALERARQPGDCPTDQHAGVTNPKHIDPQRIGSFWVLSHGAHSQTPLGRVHNNVGDHHQDNQRIDDGALVKEDRAKDGDLPQAGNVNAGIADPG